MIDLESLKSIYSEAQKMNEQRNIQLEKQRIKDEQSKLNKEFNFMIAELKERLEFAANYSPCLVVGWFGADNSVALLDCMDNSSLKKMLRTEFFRGADNSISYTPLLAPRYERSLCGNLKRVYEYLKELNLNPVLRISASPNVMNEQRSRYLDCVPKDERPGQQDMYQEFAVTAPKAVKKPSKDKPDTANNESKNIVLGIEVAIVWG